MKEQKKERIMNERRKDKAGEMMCKDLTAQAGA